VPWNSFGFYYHLFTFELSATFHFDNSPVTASLDAVLRPVVLRQHPARLVIELRVLRLAGFWNVPLLRLF
jgi:hypothetical protein